MSKVGVLISGSGTNLQALLDAAQAPGYPAQIGVVISNRPGAGGLERAQRVGVPAMVVPHRGRDRATFEVEMIEVLKAHDVEWVVCAGFMRVLTDHFLSAFPNRVLNIHPALLPSFPGMDGQGQAFRHGTKVAGATVHLVDAGTDTGPIVMQGVVPVLQDDDEASLQQRILAVEHQILPKAVAWAASGRLRVVDRGVWVEPPEPMWMFGACSP